MVTNLDDGEAAAGSPPQPPTRIGGGTEEVEVRVATLGGHLCTVHLGIGAGVATLKAAVEAQTGIPATAQRLLRGTMELVSDWPSLPGSPPGASAELLRPDAETDVEDEARLQPLELSLVRRPAEQARWLEELARGSPFGARSWLKQAPEAARRDREVVYLAVRRNPAALEFAGQELKRERALVLLAVAAHGHNLRFASPELRADREVALAAVTRSWTALQFAAAAMQSDREVVVTAVSLCGMALQYASSELRADREVVSAAYEGDARALLFASDALQAEFGIE